MYLRKKQTLLIIEEKWLLSNKEKFKVKLIVH